VPWKLQHPAEPKQLGTNEIKKKSRLNSFWFPVFLRFKAENPDLFFEEFENAMTINS
jgi:hypothetical protein